MLKSRKLKIIIGAVVMLAVLVGSSIWATSSIRKNSVEDFEYTTLATSDSVSSSLTQIDHIIENSNSTDDSVVTTYNVLIITPSSADVSAVKTFFEANSDGFKDYIVDDYRTIDATMSDSKVAVTVYTAASLNALSKEDVTAVINNADLIYLVGSDTAYTSGDDAFSEDLYDALHNYAFGASKPLIISYSLANSGADADVATIINNGVDSNVYFMTTQDFKNSWKRTRTLNIADWTISTAADNVVSTLESFMSSSRSLYISYALNSNTVPTGYDSWAAYWTRGGQSGSTLNVLYIYGDDGNTEFSHIETVASWMIGDGKNYVFSDVTGSYIPENVNVESAVASNLTVDSLYWDTAHTIKKYDYIFIAPDTYSADQDMSAEVVSELEMLSEDTSSLTYILFGTLVGATTVTSGGSNANEKENLTIDTSYNFGKLLDLSVTTTGYAKKSNVMVVGTEYMNTLAGDPSKNPVKAGEVASLINKSTYRGYAGTGAGSGSGSVSTTAFRVLELQPCYPIDLEMALNTESSSGKSYNYNGYTGIGNYYTTPSDVINTTEIDSYIGTSGTMTTEYYQWDLSKAKIAYALNMSVDQIELVQMSTEEFITSKTDVAESFDLIYIGGNTSALKPHTGYLYYMANYSSSASDGSVSYMVSNWFTMKTAASWNTNPDITAIYSMFSHTGEIASIVSNLNSDYSYSVMNGNDITYDRYTELVDYIDSGLPIVFSNEVWETYLEAKSDGYANYYIDPDSNMYALLSYADEQSSSSSNISTNWQIKTKDKYIEVNGTYYAVDTWSINADATQTVSNDSGTYGSASTVTTFTDDLSDVLYELVYGENSVTRPKYTIETNAVAYTEGDASTYVDTHSLTWTLTLQNAAAGHSYKAYLIEDADDNAEYELSEQLTSTEFVSGTATLTYEYPEDQFGAFSWGILVVDTTDTEKQPSTSYSAISMIQRSDSQPKKEATVLEIMPFKSTDVGTDAERGVSLYLDSTYQQSGVGSKFRYSTYTDYAYGEAPYGYAPILQARTYYSNDFGTLSIEQKTTYNGYYLGMYQSKIGINRYDTAGNYEDWTYNYFDSISEDYDITLDIMYLDDFEYYVSATRSLTDTQRENYAKDAADDLAVYESYFTEGTANYTALTTVENALIQALEDIRDGKGYGGYASSEFDTTDIDGIIQSGNYFRFFYSNNNGNASTQAFYNGVYAPYVEVHDKVIDAYRRYRHYSMLSYDWEEYLRSNYDVIVVGIFGNSSNFQDFSEDACTDLQNFLEANGSLFMTHDNISYDGNAVNYETTLRSYVGMSRFAQLTTAEDNTTVSKLTAEDSNRYFVTTLSSNGLLGSKNSSGVWATNVNTWLSATSDNFKKATIGYVGYTDYFLLFSTTQNRETMFYSFAEVNLYQALNYNFNFNSEEYTITGTTKAEQVNRGVVTTYPFYISSDMRISPTHNQTYALDLEDDQVTVWYTFAADNKSSSNGVTAKEASSLYAASPKDGMDSYYIYSIGNVTYCGVGHSVVTGGSRDNNDERKLLLNVLVNMAQNSGKTATVENDIILYDPDGTTVAPGNVVKWDAENSYYIEVNSSISYPEFAFSIKKSSSDTITDVQVFYDLDYAVDNESNDVYTDDENHVLVTLPSDIISLLANGDTYILSKENVPTLITKSEFFDAYDGSYTYLVVRVTVTDNKGKETVLVKRIKIMLTRELLDLT